MTYGRTILGPAVAFALLLALALPTGCGTSAEATGSGAATPASGPATVADEDTATADSDSGTGTNGRSTPSTGSSDNSGAGSGTSGTGTSGSGTSCSTADTITVRLYWVSAGENALGVERTLPYTQATGAAALNALFEGPTDAELTTWPAIGTAIPEDTELLGLTISNGVAKVDVSQEFASGVGTFSVTARVAQVVYTLTQFPTVDSVEFFIAGQKVEVFSNEGLILDGPQEPDDYYGLLPIDA